MCGRRGRRLAAPLDLCRWHFDSVFISAAFHEPLQRGLQVLTARSDRAIDAILLESHRKQLCFHGRAITWLMLNKVLEGRLQILAARGDGQLNAW